jgi:hypothetical protein
MLQAAGEAVAVDVLRDVSWDLALELVRTRESARQIPRDARDDRGLDENQPLLSRPLPLPISPTLL